jgi:hypothetical protein
MNDPRPAMQEALKQAMLQKDGLRRDVLRTAIANFKQAEVDTRQALTAEDAVLILQKDVKRRRESIDEARKVGRDDVAQAEETELAILEPFLPTMLAREEVEALARQAIAESGAESAKDMGKVMGALMPHVKGRADGKLVNEVVRALLS